MKGPVKVLIAQINTLVGDLTGNSQKIIKALKQARLQAAEFVIFPELTITGYPPEDLLYRKPFIQKNMQTLKSILPHTQGLCAIVGFVDRDKKGRLFNAAAILADKKIIGIYHKTKLPNYGVFDEKRYFLTGGRDGLFQFKGLKFGVTICEDIWQKDAYSYRADYAGRADFLVNISASPYAVGKQKERQYLVSKLAKTVKAPVIYVNLVGGQDELVFDGGSLIVDAHGQVLARGARFEEESLFYSLFLASDPRKGRMLSKKHPVLDSDEEVYRALVLGTRDYVHKNGFRKVVIGMSGGIDSALVARIAVDALGAGNVIGVTMPSKYTSRGTYQDAKMVTKNLGMQLLEFNIIPIFKSYLAVMQKTFKGLASDSTEENLQARVRGNLLLALSNKFGYLVLTTGNKSEMATGYCTLYGDMAGGFAVIKDLPKTLVFRLARYRNSIAPKNSIPLSVLKRPPTAELRANQTDQDTLPPYPLLDTFLEYYVEKDMGLEEIKKKGLPSKLISKISGMVDQNEYKRRQAPPGIKITPKAFGKDRRMPITHRCVH